MRKVKTSRTLRLKDASSGPPAYARVRPIHATFGPAGEAPNEGAEEDAAAEWQKHVDAGRIGGG
jgi:hypothetical protein